MALTFKFYRTIEIGTGTRIDPFRSHLVDYIVNDGSGSAFSDWHHAARSIRYHLARCDQAIHNQLSLDPLVNTLSPELFSVIEVIDWLNGSYINISQIDRDLIELDGINLGWANNQHDRRDLWRYISRHHALIQDLARLKDKDALILSQKALADTMDQIPLISQLKIKNWMQNRGLDTSSITATTSIRQVLQYLHDNIRLPILQFGPFPEIKL